MDGYKGIMQYSEKGRVSVLLSLLGRKINVLLPIDKVIYAGEAL
jgi:hypothetical protein